MILPMCEASLPRSFSFCFCRARYKQTARKTVKTGGKSTGDARPPAKLIIRSSGAPTRKSDSSRGENTARGHGEAAQNSVKKRKRFRPGALALKEIRRYQSTTELLVPRASFQRIVKEIATSIIAGFRFQTTAIIALHFAACLLYTSPSPRD